MEISKRHAALHAGGSAKRGEWQKPGISEHPDRAPKPARITVSERI
jgi:hypothetical protein